MADYPQHYTGKFVSLEELMSFDWDQCPQPTPYPVTKAIRRSATEFVLDIEGFIESSGTLTLDRQEGAQIVGSYRDRNGRYRGVVRLENIAEREDGELILSGHWTESNREPWLWAASLTIQ
ncbi:MAG: hypothetical protein OXC18_04975 [Desulfurellaceae bacterium]|nr:hypothetical protein [Desulfurellaceae bacterium]